MMLNEIIGYCKAVIKKLMIFKVDLKKAYGCLEWGYLLDAKKKMGFSPCLSDWIMATLSSRASIIMNDAPTQEFHVERGLAHDDPLWTF